MKKLVVVFSGIVIGAAILFAGAICLVWLTSENGISIKVCNDSKTILHDVTIVGDDLQGSNWYDVSPTGCTGPIMPARTKLSFRVRFEAEGQDYDIPVKVWALPFGLWNVSVRIDDRMQATIKSYGTFRA